MRTVTLKIDLFADAQRREQSELVLRYLLEVLCAANVLYLQQHPHTPGIYQSGVRYAAEEPACKTCPFPEEWLAIPYVLAAGKADCEDLACWRVAELLMQGVPARPGFSYRMLSPQLAMYHIFVVLPDGSIEDPSRKLGMR
jgi:hypothetical protein